MIDAKKWSAKGVESTVRMQDGSILIDLDLSVLDADWQLLAPVLNRSKKKFTHLNSNGPVWAVTWTSAGVVQMEFRAISGWKRSPDLDKWMQSQFRRNIMKAIRHVLADPKFAQRVALAMLERDRSAWKEDTLDFAELRERARKKTKKLLKVCELIAL